jgi:polar amino acid transport system substrate-binding protein
MNMRRAMICSAAIAVALASAFALTGCSNTEGASSSGGSSKSVPSVSLSGVTKDASLASRVPEGIRDRGTLAVGSDTTYAPAEFITSGGKATGYDVDLAKAIGLKLGLKTKVETANFDSILPALGSKYDLGLSGFSITNERLKSVNMVSYLNGGSSLLVKKGNPKKLTLDNLCGQKIAVQTGTTQQDDMTDLFDPKCTAAGKPKVQVVPLNTTDEAITRLTTGAAVGVMSDQVQMSYAAEQSNGALQVISDSYARGDYGIAVAKSDTALAQLVTDTVNSLIKDGTYAKIFQAWGAKANMIDTAALNPAAS